MFSFLCYFFFFFPFKFLISTYVALRSRTNNAKGEEVPGRPVEGHEATGGQCWGVKLRGHPEPVGPGCALHPRGGGGPLAHARPAGLRGANGLGPPPAHGAGPVLTANGELIQPSMLGVTRPGACPCLPGAA